MESIISYIFVCLQYSVFNCAFKEYLIWKKWCCCNDGEVPRLWASRCSLGCLVISSCHWLWFSRPHPTPPLGLLVAISCSEGILKTHAYWKDTVFVSHYVFFYEIYSLVQNSGVQKYNFLKNPNLLSTLSLGPSAWRTFPWLFLGRVRFLRAEVLFWEGGVDICPRSHRPWHPDTFLSAVLLPPCWNVCVWCILVPLVPFLCKPHPSWRPLLHWK